MIIDVLSESRKYEALNENFKIVFDYLKKNDLKSKECGKYEIKGNEIYYNLQEYETKPEQKLEAHKKYIDIQVVVSGSEYMGYCNINETKIKEEYDEQKDVMFLSGNTENILAKEGSFVIFYPADAHKPALCKDSSQKVKKAIFKILEK